MTRREQKPRKESNDSLDIMQGKKFFHKRHAEKVTLKDGRVVVKITTLNFKRPDKEVVWVHCFESGNFSKITETFSGPNAIDFWNATCSEPGAILPEDVTKNEFGRIHRTIEMASMTPQVYFLRRKALSVEKEFNLQSN